MAEEKFITTGSDDVNVLRVLLHEIHGLSPVSSPDLAYIPVEVDSASDEGTAVAA